MTAFVAALLFVTLAEMGDKTQLLAMAFATRFPARTVLVAVFVATILNHALAVAAGKLLTSVIPVDVIALVAALSFILFGLWTIRGDTLEGEDEPRNGHGPLLTVGIAFFLAEIGDKTQLTTISLAVRYDSPVAVLLGTTSGMVVADGLGILLGATIVRRVPDAVIRLTSAGVFIAFGFLGVGAVLPAWMAPGPIALVLLGLAVATLGAAHALFLQRRRQEAHPGVFSETARLPRHISQLLFAGLLIAGWVMSLGLVEPLAAVDHWIAFAVLAGLGWKVIHEAVRLKATRRTATMASEGLVMVLAGLTCIHVVMAGIPVALIAAPAAILLLAVLVMLCAPLLERGWPGHRSRRIVEARVTIGSGLLLVAIATHILIEHLR